MDKHTEIEILRAAVRELGHDSYCGPWLASQIALIERDLASDTPPVPDWVQSRNICDRAVNSARQQAATLIKVAQGEADDIRKKSRDQADSLSCRVLEALRKATKELEAI